MENYRSEGDAITLVAPSGGVASGSPYKIGGIFGVATTTAAATESFVLQMTGVVELPKVSTEPWAQGAFLYWMTDSGLMTSVSTDNLLVGFATAATVNPSSTGLVRLNGGATPTRASLGLSG